MTLRLVTLSSSHLEVVRKWRTSEEVSRFMFSDPIITPEGQLRWFSEKVRRDQSARWWVIEDEGSPIGVVNVTGIDYTNRRCEWGYYIGDASRRGMGIGTRLALTIHSVVFEQLKLNRLITLVLSDNEAGMRLPQRVGCVREGVLREHVLKRGTFRDVVVFALLAAEWQDKRHLTDVEPIEITT